MLQLLVGTKYEFMKRRHIGYVFSGACILITIISLVVHGGPRLSIDFTGGTLMQLKFSQPTGVDKVRRAVDAAGYRGSEIQEIGESGEILVRIQTTEGARDPFPIIKESFSKAFPGVTVDLRREEAVGPKIGKELKGKAIMAIFWSLLGILAYVGIRYEFRFALGAVLALFHDVFIALGAVSVMNKEVSLTVVAALLTLAGYSINDTIVVFDRIRERGRILRKEGFIKVFDTSINETLSRTIITAFTVFLTVIALFLFGGEVIHDFSFVMLVGVVFGTYSSVFVASALALDIALFRQKRLRR